MTAHLLAALRLFYHLGTRPGNRWSNRKRWNTMVESWSTRVREWGAAAREGKVDELFRTTSLGREDHWRRWEPDDERIPSQLEAVLGVERRSSRESL